MILMALSLLTAMSFAVAQTSSGPLFTHFPSRMICAENSFVAMSPGVLPAELVIIRIGRRGIEEPQKIAVGYQDVYGMKCNYQRVELLVLENGSDNFSRLPFTIGENTIQREKVIPIDYSKSGKGPEFRLVEDFHKIQSLPLGDWYVSVPAFPRFNIQYELHFTRSEQHSANGLTTTLVVDLLEESLDRKVSKVVPLIKEENFEAAE